MSAWRWVESILLLLPIRVALAALFGTAAVLKLADPQAFLFTMKAFGVFDADRHDYLLILLAFAIPWAELLAAAALLLGFWTRSAALLLSLLLLAFSTSLLMVISRHIDTSCSCFGSHDFICKGAVGWCHVARNAVLLVASVLVAWRGGGGLALDALCGRGGCRKAAVEPEPTPA
ncbi:MAG: DoxX family membrane protein [Phycisphaeraceae bacterium]|nr:MAG: DoxX family membrane protein [Phycisphaeraceae bacterium]